MYRAQMTESTVAVPGGRLFAIDEGRPGDPPVVLLHAGIAELRSWDDCVPPLLAAGYRVVRFDQRGYGRTVTEDVGYAGHDDVVAVLDALHIGRAALVGNSMGGSMAFDTAIAAPTRVVAVVGVGAGLGGFEVPSTDEEEALFLQMEAVEAAWEGSSGADRTTHLEHLLDLETRFWMDGPGQPTDRVPAILRERLTAWNRAHYADDRVQGRRQRLDPPAAGRLHELGCPILAIAGDLDVSDVAAAVDHLATHAPDARAVHLPGVAHMIGMEVPETLASLVIDFLAPLPRWA